MQSTIQSVRPFSSKPTLYNKCTRVRNPCIRLRAETGSSGASECSTSGTDNIWMRSLVTLSPSKLQPMAAATLLVLGMAATAGNASASDFSDLHAQPLAELAEEDFLGNIARYGRYFVTVMLGTGYVMLRPLQSMLKRPVTAILAIMALIALFIGTRLALEYMLGISEYDYSPDNFRIATQY